MSKEEQVVAAKTELKLAIHEYIELFRSGKSTLQAENNIYIRARGFSKAVEDWDDRMWNSSFRNDGIVICPS